MLNALFMMILSSPSILRPPFAVWSVGLSKGPNGVLATCSEVTDEVMHQIMESNDKGTMPADKKQEDKAATSLFQVSSAIEAKKEGGKRKKAES